jgi:hypothetical protein
VSCSETHDEVRITEPGWAPTTELAAAEPGVGPSGTRTGSSPRYDYYALHPELDAPAGSCAGGPTSVVRTWIAPSGHHNEQQYAGGPSYASKLSHIQSDMFDGRERGELVPITDETALRLIG